MDKFENANRKLSWQTSVAMFLLAAYPLLTTYVSAYNLNYGEIALALFLVISVIISRSLTNISFPKGYILFWALVSIALIVNSGSFRITYLIPGGIACTLFSLNVGNISGYFINNKLRKYITIIFLLSVVVYFFQILNLVPAEYKNTFILPISDHIGYDGYDLNELRDLRWDNTRPCSFFLEPAYYAQFILIFLTIELFRMKNANKICTLLSVVAIALLVVLRSGLGMVGLAIILITKFFVYFKNSNKARLYFLFIISIALIIVFYFAQSVTGVELLARTEELETEGSSGFVRLLQGYYIYNALPVVNKFIGCDVSMLESMQLPFVTYVNNEAILFTNGFSTLLIRTGLLGALILVYVYVQLFKNGNLLAKAIIVLLLTMSLVEQVYINSSMLVCTIIAYKNQKT